MDRNQDNSATPVHPIDDFVSAVMSGMAGMALAARAMSYTDYLAATICAALKVRDPEGIIAKVGAVKWDLHPRDGYLLSTKKTIEITGRNGNRYRVTVEDAR